MKKSYNVLADITNGLKCGFLHHFCTVLVGHIAC